MDLLLLFVSSIFIHNILLSRFLGCCPFMGISTKLETARGMGLAVVFVILLSSLMTWSLFLIMEDSMDNKLLADIFKT